MADAARAFTYDAMDRIEKEARTALAATSEGDTLVTQLAALAPLRQTCARRYDRAPPSRGASRDGAGQISIRRPLAGFQWHRHSCLCSSVPAFISKHSHFRHAALISSRDFPILRARNKYESAAACLPTTDIFRLQDLPKMKLRNASHVPN